MTVGQRMVHEAGIVIIITAVFARTMWKYGQRGYRYILLDAGHLAQTIYLCADSLGLAAGAVGGFYDAELNEYLNLPEGEEALYLLTLGRPVG
jgi:SagB-type dehydrogenase family enzyme